jgi:hypothetical protein
MSAPAAWRRFCMEPSRLVCFRGYIIDLRPVYTDRNVYRYGGSYYQPTNNCGCWVCRW